MKVFFDSFSGCDSMGLLSPGNDTRVNFVFLLADRQAQKLAVVPPRQDATPGPSVFTPADWGGFSGSLATNNAGQDGDASGEGTVCVSDAKGRADFVAAVGADKEVTDSEKATLNTARQTLICTDGTTKDAAAPARQRCAIDQCQGLCRLSGGCDQVLSGEPCRRDRLCSLGQFAPALGARGLALHAGPRGATGGAGRSLHGIWHVAERQDRSSQSENRQGCAWMAI